MQNSAKQYSIKRLLPELFLLVLFVAISNNLFDYLGWNFFLVDTEALNNSPLIDLFEDSTYFKIILFAFTGNVIVALSEELFFRLVPYLLWRRLLYRIPYWIMGLVTSLIFSILHTNPFNGFELPLAQFVAGLYFWKLIGKKDGYKWASTAHFGYNLLLLLLTTVIAVVLE